ncbi:transcription factor IIIB 50 kDa subunit [Amia ocellicauda]|uniref:transcription factor IIIB 50 kDa subunit n=1 Tax=Amia ocellicauda TaxID=2972642 RepID=UPI003463D52A|nr:BRF2 factor [Amia calva]
MASAHKCPGCGSCNLVDDCLYSQSQLVCADCGAVVSEGLLTTTRSEELQGTDVRYSDSAGVEKQPGRTQIKGLQRVRTICRVLRFPAVVEESALILFEKAYRHPNFLGVSLWKKELLAGCCVLVSCRQHGWPVTMGTISSLLHAEPGMIGGVYLEMVRCLQLQCTSSSLSELVQSHCSSFQLSAPGVPEQLHENTLQLSKRAASLVELASEAWLVTGRQPVPILTAAIYLAWLSLNPCKARLRFSLGKFCKLAGVSLPPPTIKRVAELQDALCKLGKELPWLRGTQLEQKTVVRYTEDILKCRTALLRRAMQRLEREDSGDAVDTVAMENSNVVDEKLDNEEPTATSDLAQDTVSVSAAAGTEDNSEALREVSLAVDNLCSGRSPADGAADTGQLTQRPTQPPWGDATQIVSKTTDGTQGGDLAGVATESEKRHHSVFLPPCMTNPSKRRRVEARPEEGKEVTGDEEISDSEIEGYLRSPQEMRDFAAAQAKLG